MPLSDTAIRNAKPNADKALKLADEKSMYLLIHQNGSKYFRFDYRFDGKRKTLALGTYPETSLKQARDKRDIARQQIAEGIDPNENRKAVKQARAASVANSFEVVAREWFLKKMKDKSESHKKRTIANLERDVFPYIGRKPIADIKAPELLVLLRKVEKRGAIETAHRILYVCGVIFRYAISDGKIDTDVSSFLKGALSPPVKGHFGATTDPKELGALLRAIDGYTGSLYVKSALQLAPMVFVRPGELRAMEWEHLDFDSNEWRYFVTKTKVGHIVPLSKQALVIIEELRPLTGHGRFVFPSERTPNGSRCMSDVALLAALRRMGFGKEEVTVHGFRATARTILDEVLEFRVDLIEHQLAHRVIDPNGRAYNRTAHIEARKDMMQLWSDYLDKLKTGAEILPFQRKA